jgi:hypothetical protein
MCCAGSLAEGDFPAGTFIVRLDQPYRNYAVDLLTPQQFPEDAEHEPYDDISWALPVHYGVRAIAIADERIKGVPFDAVDGELQPAGHVSGGGPVFLLRDTGQEALLAARFRLQDFRIEIAAAAFSAGGLDYPAGSWVIPDQPGLRAALERVAGELALDVAGAGAPPEVVRHEAPVPRVGVWVPWADTDSIGWIRYGLDQRQVPYTYLRDEEIRGGNLREQVDVIVYGHVRLGLASQIRGIEPVAGPMPFTATPEFPSHGTPAASDDITGGIGWTGMSSLQAFVEEGGVLVTLGNGSALALDSGLLPGMRRAPDRGISTPGAALRASFDWPDHPIAYGYPARTTAFRSNYPVYDVPVRWPEMAYCTSCLQGPLDRRRIVLQWGTRDAVREDDNGADAGSASGGESMVVSGGARNVEALDGMPAILDVPVGRGRVIAFNFNPLHRDLNRADHRYLWNVILNWRSLPEPRP